MIKLALKRQFLYALGGSLIPPIEKRPDLIPDVATDIFVACDVL